MGVYRVTRTNRVDRWNSMEYEVQTPEDSFATVHGTEMSCGVKMITGIGGLLRGGGDLKEHIKNILRVCDEYVDREIDEGNISEAGRDCLHFSVPFVLLSDNTINERPELDEIAEYKTTKGLNPNSHKDIVIWVIKLDW